MEGVSFLIDKPKGRQDRTSGDRHGFGANRAIGRNLSWDVSDRVAPGRRLVRTRTGAAWVREPLAHDFADVRALAFPGDKRRLMDMRRSGVVEAVAGDAGPIGLAAKLANSIGRSNTLHKTYAPVDIEAVRNTDAARLKGRRRMRRRERKRGKTLKKVAGRSLKFPAYRR